MVHPSQVMNHSSLPDETNGSFFITRKNESLLDLKSPGCGIGSIPVLIYSGGKGGRVMKIPMKRGEKGFTLIELLIVVAILGVLAAVVIPNVGRFLGKGEDEAQETEFATLQAALHAMMIDNDLSELPAGGFVIQANATNDMTAFPCPSSTPTYVLWGHTINATGQVVNYLATNQSSYLYWTDSLGTLYQGAKAP
jgi:prepilin-type N-terminal cleavage/methylation domain-containing protein